MLKKFIFLAILLLLFPLGAFAKSVTIAEGVRLDFELPSERWEVTQTPPAPLVEEASHHLEHELEAKGQHPPEDWLLEQATKRLSANELFIYNPETLSNLTVDFSALREDEKAPKKKTVKLSTEYSVDSLRGEEAVTDVKHKVMAVTVKGAQYAFALDADYRHHEEPMKFLGITGFADPHWFYLYYTDYVKAPGDLKEMNEILDSIQIVME